MSEADALVGILSATSVRSTYVLIELGARWGFEKHLLPLPAPGTSASVLGGPLAGKNALKAENRAEVMQMVDEVAEVLRVPLQPAASYMKYVDKLTAANSGYEPVAVQIGVDPRDVRVQVGPPPSPEDREWLSVLSTEGRDLLVAAAKDANAQVMVTEILRQSATARKPCWCYAMTVSGPDETSKEIVRATSIVGEEWDVLPVSNKPSQEQTSAPILTVRVWVNGSSGKASDELLQ